MGDIDENYSDLCRICCTKTSILVGLNIYEGEGPAREIDKKISSCLPIQINKDDQLPKMLCNECVYNVELFYNFRQKSLETESILVNTIKKINENELKVTETVNTTELAYEQALLALDGYMGPQFEDKLPIISSCVTLLDVKDETQWNTPTYCISEEKDTTKEEENVDKTCRECGKKCRSNYKLAEHMRKHTGEKPFICETCGKGFRSKIGLSQHFAGHTGQYSFTCTTCGKGFACRSYLVAHSRAHTTERSHVCSQCSRKFKTRQACLDHENRHLGIRPHACTQCSRKFVTRALLLGHVKARHTSGTTREHECPDCGRKFASRSYVRVHRLTHTGVRPHACNFPNCSRSFLTRGDLNAHCDSAHSEKSGGGKWQCETCGRGFVRRDALRTHQRTHTGERPYACAWPGCARSFAQHTAAVTHRRLHTGARPHRCEIGTCDKTFVTKSALKQHINRHHPDNTNNTVQ